MSGPTPPRAGRLLTGGPNSLELLWATVACILLALGAILSLLAWAAVALEAGIADRVWAVGPTEMPRLLAAAASGDVPLTLVDAVGSPWRLGTIAAALHSATVAGVSMTVRRWLTWRAGWRHRQHHKERLHSPAWATRRDLRTLTAPIPRRGADEPPADGRLWLGHHRGRDLLVPKATSVLVVAPTRTGKSTRLVIPNLLRWDGPAVVTSVKRDVLDLTATRRADAFGPVHLFDPTGATGEPSVRWSPLLSSTTYPDATRTATWLTDAAAVEDNNDSAKFWETLATKLLAPMLYAAARTNRTMIDVSRWVDTSAFEPVAAILQRLGDQDAIAAWQAITDLPNETRGSVLGTAMAIFRAFGSPRVRDATSCTPTDMDNALDIDQMLQDNGTLYLVSPEYEQTELRPLFVAIVQAVYRAAVQRSASQLQGRPLDPPLLLMLDEAGNIAPLQNLPKIAATGAGQGITLMTIWQDRSQIRELYGDAERTLISNHTTTVWLPGSQDLDTLNLLSELIGQQWISSDTVSTAGDGSINRSEGSERADIAPPSFLRTLDADRSVVLTGNRPPVLMCTEAFYLAARWRRHSSFVEVPPGLTRSGKRESPSADRGSVWSHLASRPEPWRIDAS